MKRTIDKQYLVIWLIKFQIVNPEINGLKLVLGYDFKESSNIENRFENINNNTFKANTPGNCYKLPLALLT